jgi:hypothetical protein
MRIKALSVGRLWFVACETAVIVIPLLGLQVHEQASYVDLLMPTFKIAWPALLVTSFIFLKFDRRLTLIGLITCFLAAFWGFLPTQPS